MAYYEKIKPKIGPSIVFFVLHLCKRFVCDFGKKRHVFIGRSNLGKK